MIAEEAEKFEIFDRLTRGGAIGMPIAVVGASRDPAKYGHIVVANLSSRGYTVFPVHPTEKEIAGLEVYPSLSALPGPVAIACVVTPPPVSRKILVEADAVAVPVLWFQDGSWDEGLRPALESALTLCVVGACVMVVAGRHSS